MPQPTSTMRRLGDNPLLVDALDSHFGSAREFHARVRSEFELTSRLAQWMEWLDVALSRRFATSVMIVGAIALLIALFA